MNKPVKKIIQGNIVLDVWLNDTLVNGEMVGIPNITIKRKYKDKDNGQYISTTNFRPKDVSNIEAAISDLKNYLEEQSIQ